MSPDAMITHFVGASALVLVVAHAAGWLARRLKQPYIVGQLSAGIALGPPCSERWHRTRTRRCSRRRSARR
ncbi:hypothetical protein LV779_14305 [Streptomyces thinghirensis]|nr:hypothetical protein [Streptomyces thinghirensis]